LQMSVYAAPRDRTTETPQKATQERNRELSLRNEGSVRSGGGMYHGNDRNSKGHTHHGQEEKNPIHRVRGRLMKRNATARHVGGKETERKKKMMLFLKRKKGAAGTTLSFLCATGLTKNKEGGRGVLNTGGGKRIRRSAHTEK